jgi:4-amino-4-deoxy-L-arabinose transferase-like glycosyltransferase
MIVLICLSGAIRIPALFYGFPEIVMRDELTYAGVSLRMFEEGSLDPKEYRYGNFIHYFYCGVFAPFYYGGRLFGAIPAGEPAPEWPFYLMARSLSLLASLAALVALYRLGKKLFRAEAGLAAAILLAANPTFFRYGQLCKLDIYVLLLSLLAAWVLLEMRSRRGFHLAGVILGVGTSIKYSMAALGPCILLVFFLRKREKSETSQPPFRWVVESLAVGGALALLFNLFVFIHFDEARKQFHRQYSVTIQGEHPMASTLPSLGPAALVTLHLPDAMGWPLTALALAGWLYWLVHDLKRWLLVSIYPAIHYLMVSRWGFAFPRELLPVYPPLYLGGATLSLALIDRVHRWNRSGTVQLVPYLAAGLCLFSLVRPIQEIYSKQRKLIAGNTKVMAKQWIKEYLPKDALLAREVSALPLSPREIFSYSLASHPYDWFGQQGVQDLIMSRLPESVLKNSPELAENDRQIRLQAKELMFWDPVSLGVEGPPLGVYLVPENSSPREADIK